MSINDMWPKPLTSEEQKRQNKLKTQFPQFWELMSDSIYHQDIFLDFKSHEDVWKHFCDVKQLNPIDLLDEANVFLKEPPEVFFEFTMGDSRPSAFGFKNVGESRAWLQRLHDFLLEYIAAKGKDVEKEN